MLKINSLANNIKINKAQIDDIPKVLKLYGQIDNNDVLTVEEAGKMLHKFQLYPDYSLYVAKVENKIVGTFELLIMDNLAHRGIPSGVVEDVVVDEKFRSQGIGKK